MATQAPSPGIKLLTMRGVPIYLGRNWPFILIVFFIVFQGTGNAASVAAKSALWSLVLLVSVIAHEAAHAVTAQAGGLHVQRIVCDVWGGHTSFLPVGLKPGRAAWVALAGPLANLALAVVALAVGLAVPATASAAEPFLWMNGALFLFNVLPGLPLDGGQVVSALAWKVTGDRTQGWFVGAWAGRGVTILVLLAYWGLPMVQGQQPSLISVVWMGMVGFLMWRTTSMLLAAVKVRRVTDQIKVRDVARPTPTVPADATLGQVEASLARGTGALVLDGDRPLGLLVVGRPGGGATTTAGHAAEAPGGPGWAASASLDEGVSDVVAQMQIVPTDVMALQVGPGQYGLVWRQDIAAAFDAHQGTAVAGVA